MDIAALYEHLRTYWIAQVDGKVWPRHIDTELGTFSMSCYYFPSQGMRFIFRNSENYYGIRSDSLMSPTKLEWFDTYGGRDAIPPAEVLVELLLSLE
jgi:hypothetical protein